MFHILVVDDDKHTRMLLRAVLENANYTVTTATNGEEALGALDREHIDLVVLDIMMPKMDGYEFTRIVRETDSALPILMVTAKHLPSDEKKGFLVGTDDYITKPIDEEKLLLRIRALLRRAQIVNEHKITVGDVVLDYNSFTVTKNGETQELPQKEFQAPLLPRTDLHPYSADGRDMGYRQRERLGDRHRPCRALAQTL